MKSLLVFCTLIMTTSLFGTMRTFYIGDDFNQFFSDEGVNHDLTIQWGDTVQWVALGTPAIDHTVTSTSIPIDAVSFDYQWNPPANVYFEYIPTKLGLHEFECSIHEFVFNMIGSFNVEGVVIGLNELIYSYMPPHPNPFKNMLNFSYEFIGVNYALYNTKGQEVSQGVIGEEMDLSNLMSGMYVLIVFFDQPKIFRLVKE